MRCLGGPYGGGGVARGEGAQCSVLEVDRGAWPGHATREPDAHEPTAQEGRSNHAGFLSALRAAVLIPGAIRGAQLDGFTIWRGYGGEPLRGGAGLYLADATIVVVDCRFVGNEAPNGGAVFVDSGVDVGFWSCTFLDNEASDGGAITVLSVAGNHLSEVFCNRCRFLGNDAQSYGGAIDTVVGDVTVWNSVFTGNVAGSRGGAVAVSGHPSTSMLTNCSFTRNTAGTGGAAYCSLGSLTLRNSILFADSATTAPEVHTSASGSTAVDSCCITGAAAFGGSGNFDDDPAFLDADGADDVPGAEDHDLRIAHPAIEDSPCVDAGENGFLGGAHLQLDLDGDTRKMKPYLSLATAIVDVGAQEVAPLFVLLPGSSADLGLFVRVNGLVRSVAGTDAVELHADDQVTIELASPRGSQSHALGFVALQLHASNLLPEPLPIPGVHVGTGAIALPPANVPCLAFQAVIPPGLVGLGILAQGFVFDPQAPGGLATTNGRQLRLR